jgi:hypothetical protein
MLAFRGDAHPEENNLTATAAGAWILEHTPVEFQVRPLVIAYGNMAHESHTENAVH